MNYIIFKNKLFCSINVRTSTATQGSGATSSSLAECSFVVLNDESCRSIRRRIGKVTLSLYYATWRPWYRRNCFLLFYQPIHWRRSIDLHGYALLHEIVAKLVRERPLRCPLGFQHIPRYRGCGHKFTKLQIPLHPCHVLLLYRSQNDGFNYLVLWSSRRKPIITIIIIGTSGWSARTFQGWKQQRRCSATYGWNCSDCSSELGRKYDATAAAICRSSSSRIAIGSTSRLCSAETRS